MHIMQTSIGVVQTASSPPTDSGGPPPTPQQTIDNAISTIENLDNIPQSVKMSVIALLRHVLDSLNSDTLSSPLRTNMP